MNVYTGRLMAATLLLLSVGAPLSAQVGEEATADRMPWSGWWWPAKSGDLVLGYRGGPSPLGKHDQLTGKHADQWEQTQPFHFDPDGADWWGHCHAWAAASVLEPEPRHDVMLGAVAFHVGDLKGLLTEAHYADHAIFYGQRFNGDPGDDFEDLYPFTLWSVLRQYVLQNNSPIVMDLNPGPQVWSYPVYRYTLTSQPTDPGTYQLAVNNASPLEQRPSAGFQPAVGPFYQGQIHIWAANFQVFPDVVGTATTQRDYTFVFQTQGNQLVANSDHWTGPSLQDHPDFAWYPTERAQENPELDYNLASELSAQAR